MPIVVMIDLSDNTMSMMMIWRIAGKTRSPWAPHQLGVARLISP
jgi:hypothetical protein